MLNFHLSLVLTALCAIFVSSSAHNLNYSVLQSMGVDCPERNKCRGYRNNKDYMDRSCECDNQCSAYNDCCIDASTSGATPETNVVCLNYGKRPFTGVYVINKCRNDWSGPEEIRQKCVDPNMSDPITSAPVTDTSRSVTYRNLYCAECNNADLAPLRAFNLGLSCDNLEGMTREEILRDIEYNQEMDSWGIYRYNSVEGFPYYVSEFVGCDMYYDVPGNLNSSVRFCRSNLVSTCAPDWSLQSVRRSCDAYMAVVFDQQAAYRNPHCAQCNHRSMDDIHCESDILGKSKPVSELMIFELFMKRKEHSPWYKSGKDIFKLFLELGTNDEECESVILGKSIFIRMMEIKGSDVYYGCPFGSKTSRLYSECPPSHTYDPFLKKCRLLLCIMPGYVLVGGRCVRS